MEIVAKAKMMRISPTKVRLVGELIKKKNVNDAMGILLFTPKKGAFILKKLPRAMGRATKLRKRISHITLILDES